MSDEWDAPVESHSHKLTDAQIVRLLEHNKLLRKRINLLQVGEIKSALLEKEYEQALILWDEFSEEEQGILWMAPLFGGIWTTDERKRLRPQEREA